MINGNEKIICVKMYLISNPRTIATHAPIKKLMAVRPLTILAALS